MRTVRPRGFERALRALDRDALAAFVGALWAAGGWETTVEGALVVAERSGRRRRIAVVAAGRGLARLRREAPAIRRPTDGGSTDRDPDVVVDAAGSRRVAAAARAVGAEYVPPGALRERLRYGVPRDVGADLSERHLDRSLERLPSPSTDGPTVGPTTLLLGAGLVVLVAGVVVGALAAGPLWFPDGPASPPSSASDAGGADANGRTPTTSTVGTSAEGSVTLVTTAESASPPGLSAAGVNDVSALADAHVAATKNRRYALNVSFDGPAAATGFEDFESVRWSVRVESRHHFRIDASYRRANDTEPRWRRLGIYADGVTVFLRTAAPDGTRYVTSPAGASDSQEHIYFASSLVERYLDTTASIVRSTETPDGPRYHVVAMGTPVRLNDSVTDYRAEALVTPEGRVTMLSARYTIEVHGEVHRVNVGVDYADFGRTRIRPPGWLDEARNETGG